MSVAIRLASAADLARLPEIEHSAATRFEGHGLPADLLSATSDAGAWRPQLAGGTLWVATVDRTPVGFLAATREGGRLHIDEVDVRREAQGQGVGRALVARAVDWARSHQLTEVTLTTFSDVPWNAPFYRSMGFEAWAHGEAPPELTARLAAEIARGLKNRCAMLLRL